jgi:membrane fusion protein, multidrug efflux system
MSKYTVLILAAGLAVACAGCGNSSDASGPAAPAKSAASSSAAPPPAAPAPKPSDPADILSVLSVEHQVDLSSQKDGVVISILKDEGAVVVKGDVLGQLDDRDLQMQSIKAKDDLQVSQNNVKYKESELKAKGAAYRRQQQLRALGLSSEADLEAAEFQAKAAEYDLRGWEALVESGQAELRRLDIEIDQMKIRAPFSGVVVHRYVREGQGVSKSEKCFRISQLGPLQVQFQVPESSGRRPERGAAVQLSLIGDSNRSLTAHVVKVSPTVDPASDSYNVTAQLSGPGLSDLRPGMAVRVDWPASAHAKP